MDITTINVRPMLAALFALNSPMVQAQTCEDVPTPPADLDASVMMAGDYRLVMIATAGSEAGAIAQGELTLRDTSSSDRSPRTGQKAQDSDIARTPFYGWAVLDFSSLGAPVGSNPDPASRDPVFPGVLVLLVSWKRDYARDTPVLLISTASNRRDDVLAQDGGGIGLWVRQLTPTSFAGRWSHWGIVANGTGFFCASRSGP